MHKYAILLVSVLLCSSILISKDFWKLTKGPYGAIVNTVCEAPNKTLLAGTQNGLYYSTDKGTNWSIMNFAGKNISSITVADSGKIYVAILGDLQLSKDNGNSWRSIDNGLDGANFKFIHPGINGKLYSIAHISHQYNKLFVANNDNGGWSQIPTSMNLIQAFDIKPGNGYFFIGTFGQGIYRSVDNGANIVKVGLDTLSVRSIMIDSSGNIYAGTLDHGLYYSTNDGDTWSYLGLEGYTIYSISKNSNYIFCGTWNDGVMRSADNGNSWIQQIEGLVNKTVQSICIDNNGRVFIGTSGDGVLNSLNNGNNWNHSSDGFEGAEATAMVANKSGRIFSATYGAGLWYTDNKGNSWIRCNNGLDIPDFIKLEINSQGHIFAGSGNGALYRSTDNGLNWMKIRNATGPMQLGDLYIDNKDNIYLAITNNGVYKSIDNGNNWSDIGLNDEVHRSILVKNDTIILVGTYTNGLFRSTNNGATWTNPGTSSSTIYAIETDDDGNIYLGGSMGQFEKSTNDGVNWSLVNNLIHQVNKILCGASGQIFAALDSDGIRVSLNYGQNWEPVNSGLKSGRVNHLVFDNDTNVYAALTEGVYTNSDLFVDLQIPTLISPTNNESNVIMNPKFIWNKVENSTEYQFQLSDREDFSNVLELFTGADSSRIADYSFEFAKKYYWRVRAKQNIYVSDWSVARCFTTTIDSPVLVSPADNSKDINSPVTFAWHPVEGATRYTLLISDVFDFSEIYSTNDVINDTTYVKSGFDCYTKYYWKVQAVGTESVSKWSEISKFTSALAAPALLAPKNDITGLKTVVECTWGSVPFATKYIIELATNPDFNLSSIVYNNESSSVNSHTFTLKYATKYYWHVKSKTSISESQWSETRSFTTGFDSPKLIAPADGSVEQSIPLVFTWEKYDKAVKYYMEISTDSAFYNIVLYYSNITGTSQSTTKILYNNTYYWRLKVFVGNTYSFWSETRSFTTGIMPPTLTLPANGEKSFTCPFILRWDYSGNASGYYIEISKDENFEEVELADSSLAKKQYTVEKLEFFEKYFWRVKAKVDNRYSLLSPAWSFNTVLNKPELLGPVNNSDKQELTLTLDWMPVIGSEYYELQVSESSLFSNFILSKDSIFDISLEVQNLSFYKKYYWKVRAKNSKGIGQWSDVWYFITKEQRVSVDELLSAKDISIFPNPFNEKIVFNLNLKQSALVAITIYDLLGNQIFIINDKVVTEGNNNFTWEANYAPIGTYFYQIKINGKITTGRISLVK